MGLWRAVRKREDHQIGAALLVRRCSCRRRFGRLRIERSPQATEGNLRDEAQAQRFSDRLPAPRGERLSRAQSEPLIAEGREVVRDTDAARRTAAVAAIAERTAPGHDKGASPAGWGAFVRG